MRFYNDLIGLDDYDKTMPYIGGDSKEQFIENAKTQPIDWYYNNTELEYSLNSQGHRCKNIEDVDKDNYILFTGCSHTLGVGLELEKTYPYLLSTELGMDYYNLAMPGTGMDAVEYNLLTWFFKMNKKPKMVVIQWPDHSRFVEYDSMRNNILPQGTWNNQSNFVSFIVNAEDSGMFNARKAITNRLIKNVVDVPIITFNFGNQRDYGIYDLNMPRLDKARDLSHAGINSHVSFTKTLINHIKGTGMLKSYK
jgi:hypothetical protein